MTKSENVIVKARVVRMSFFRLIFLKAQWLVIMLAVVAADDAFEQETIGKEERFHFKNSTLQRHYGKTVGFTASFAKELNQMESMADLASFLIPEDRRFCSTATLTFLHDNEAVARNVTRWQHSMVKLQKDCATFRRVRLSAVEGLRKQELTKMKQAGKEAKKVSCKPRAVCLELPPAPLGMSYYPQCVSVKRCGGCCNSPLLECRPINTTTVKKWVMKFQVMSKNKYEKTQSVAFIQHKSCECGCKTLASHCNEMQDYNEDSCECECRNESENQTCGYPKEWDPNLCSCICPQSLLCSTGALINPDTCKCVSGKNIKRSREKKRQ